MATVKFSKIIITKYKIDLSILYFVIFGDLVKYFYHG